MRRRGVRGGQRRRADRPRRAGRGGRDGGRVPDDGRGRPVAW
ncbi:hypothetical protein SLNWT_4185 [Streptomyces albus]|uniref:Uncharacterized protein n=1 Tax=Streptomyces albus (strain ATCC 21838 / DSM 41398 / FERM P-419 / JCM 4703 / NBRC 107858) TaxID=1081613 RepID=A0A0B5F101_STRA4|nr:hypothetical protein SLNWT_4185 [Streptomyces albus]AOU78871.1 hypothetical protein SLNHY_4180 [Streptomyces albus]